MSTPGEASAPNKRPAFEPAAELLKPVAFDPDMKRPASTVAGVALVLLRVAAGLIVLASILLDWNKALSDVDLTIEDVADATPYRALALTAGVIVLTVVLIVDAGLALLILRGHNWARVVIMTFSAISITGSFISWWSEGQEITLFTTLPTLGLDILILLALSSRSAAAYARRNEGR